MHPAHWQILLKRIIVASVFALASGLSLFAQNLKYGTASYHETMDRLAKEAQLPGRNWNRFHASVVRDFCAGDVKEVDAMVDRGEVNAAQVQSIAKVLGKSYVVKPRSSVGETYASAKQKFLKMGACSSCADNIAQYYTRKPESQCAKLARKALAGQSEAIKIVLDFPDDCKWNYP